MGRFQREAQAIPALVHPNVCTVYDIGEEKGHPYLVMELLQGQTLKERLAAGPCSNDELLSIGIFVGNGLDVAHSLCIVHRDIKPANIFLTNVSPEAFGSRRVAGPPSTGTVQVSQVV